MKLIYCVTCSSIFSLSVKNKKSCDCGKSWGQYKIDGLHAEYGGNAIPLGFVNSSFRKALFNQPKNGMGFDFTAFVIPSECDTFKVSLK